MYYHKCQSYIAQRAILQAIFQLNSPPGKIFLASDWEFFFWKLGKKEDILDREWGLYSAPGDREKRPCTLLNFIVRNLCNLIGLLLKMNKPLERRFSWAIPKMLKLDYIFEGILQVLRLIFFQNEVLDFFSLHPGVCA